MKIATWNVNSIRSRLERLLRWLEETGPEVVCLQELKVTEDGQTLRQRRDRP
jgi:exodeoxyribonuclease-3